MNNKIKIFLITGVTAVLLCSCTSNEDLIKQTEEINNQLIEVKSENAELKDKIDELNKIIKNNDIVLNDLEEKEEQEIQEQEIQEREQEDKDDEEYQHNHYQQYQLYQEDLSYLDTIVEGKETFTTYRNIIKNFGEPKEIKNIIDESGAYLHGYFALVLYDDIEFVITCCGDAEDPFYITDDDRVTRVDITGNKYVLNKSYFLSLEVKVGDSADKIAKHYNNEIIDSRDKKAYSMNQVIEVLRDDEDSFKQESGLYFSGTMDTGLCLGMVMLIDDNGLITRIIMGLPTAG
ncbi:hypothetical protein [Vallitalea guaymasensis]|uniref:Uncharacterized protein n=1 Tax=Vallitalea guaymasensis TaxID=1185412 RepID=A0A8J8M7D2_9FIRM|nr:hypothetical protein [Vallitalea guaymasensis]QUH27659.1 hypothetical protein HYG85_01505 [Vallitalea guaymasensis]